MVTASPESLAELGKQFKRTHKLKAQAMIWKGLPSKEGYTCVPIIIALISFKMSLMEGMFDGPILSGVCL